MLTKPGLNGSGKALEDVVVADFWDPIDAFSSSVSPVVELPPTDVDRLLLPPPN